MPILKSERDEPEHDRARAAQPDPWVMYLVVRYDLPASAPELFVAAAQATMRCVERHVTNPAWADAFGAWFEHSFRKVCLRAKGPTWAKLDAYDAGTGRVGDADAVRALPPRLRSRCDNLLRHLQVYNPDPATLPPPPAHAARPNAAPTANALADAAPAPAPAASADAANAASADAANAASADTDAPAMLFALNPGAPMSAGKAVAQISHAVLMCARSAWARDPRYAPAFAAWHRAGYPCRVAPPDAWAALHASADGVVVRDAGLTEVAPGTETVMALPPGYPFGR